MACGEGVGRSNALGGTGTEGVDYLTHLEPESAYVNELDWVHCAGCTVVTPDVAKV